VTSDVANRRAAFVTGAASGIGRAIATRLAADGLAVAVVDLNLDAAQVVAEEIQAAGGHAIAVRADVSDRDAVAAALAHTTAELAAPLVLVNNAGLDNFGPFLKISVGTWTKVHDVNLTGTFHCCQLALPAMIEAGWGRIVNISSSSAQGGTPYMGAYVSSKAGMIGLTKALALEFGPNGVTVNTIPPGFIDTPMLRAAAAKGFLGGPVEEHEKKTPVRRAGTPEDVAAMCSFVIRDEASYITGQVLGVNGGRNT
jgi:2-hydroxycyclohexanecarboxyl-CoA dehydrogenase